MADGLACQEQLMTVAGTLAQSLVPLAGEKEPEGGAACRPFQGRVIVDPHRALDT